MRYVVAFVLVLVASPLTAGAQEGGEGAPPPDVTEPSQETQPTQSWLRRMHPGAFEAPAKKPDPGFEIEYAPAQSQAHPEEGRHKGLSRGGKIAVGIIVPLVVVTVGVGTWVGVSLMSDPW